jgi:hypothetical protein
MSLLIQNAQFNINARPIFRETQRLRRCSAIKLVFANDFYPGKIHLGAGGCGVNNKRTLATPNFQFDRAVIPKKGVPIELPGNGGQVKAKLRQ